MVGEHFGESTFLEESTLGRALFFRESTLGRALFLRGEQHFFEGRALDATMVGGDQKLGLSPSQ